MKKVQLLVSLILVGGAAALEAAESSGPNPGNLSPAGSSSVALYTGAFTYSYPIVLPPGRKGIQPSLQLLYNSQAGNGWLGVGWDLSVGSIQRSTKNGTPTYNDSKDTFMMTFAGQQEQLVPFTTGTDSTGAYTEYHAQIESDFMRVRYYAPGTWQAWSKEGTKYIFKGQALNSTNNEYVFWALTEVIDTLGNYYLLTYPSTSSSKNPGSPTPPGAPHATSTAGGILSYEPVSIVYTGNSTQNLAPLMAVKFSYESRSDIIDSRIAGFQQALDSRLKSIEVDCNGSLVRTYTINYSSNSIGLSMLSSVVLSGKDGSSLPPTSFTYQDNTSYAVVDVPQYHPPVDFTYRDTSTASHGLGYNLSDLNGDGLEDIVGFGATPQSLTNSGFNWSDPNQAGNGSLPADLKIFDISIDEGIRFVDLNGDGLVDIIQAQEGAGNMAGYSISKAWLNDGHGGWIPAPQWALPASINFVDRLSDYSTGENGVDIVDVNGDGLPDLVLNYTGAGGSASGVWINNGNGWTLDNSWRLPVTTLDRVSWGERSDTGVRFIDLNGDGLPDIVQGEDEIVLGHGVIYNAWLNTGHGWTPAPAAYLPPAPFVYRTLDGYSFDCGIRLADLNGDGLMDMALFEDGQGGTWKGAWLNTGSGWKMNNAFLPPIRLIDRGGWGIATDEGVRLEDVNGDGIADEVQAQAAAPGFSNYAVRHAFISQEKPINVLTKIQNGLGGVTQIVYTPHVEPKGRLPMPINVVSSLTTSDGMGTSVQTTYSYQNGLYDGSSANNREFLGFKTVTTTDALGNKTITTFLQNDGAINGVNLYKGKIASQENDDANGNMLSKTTNTWNYKMLTGQDTYVTQTNSTPLYQANAGAFSGQFALNDPSFQLYGTALGQNAFATAINSGAAFSQGFHVCNYSTDTGNGCDDGSVQVTFPVNQGARDLSVSEVAGGITYYGSVNYPTPPNTYTDPNSAVQATITMKGLKRLNASYFVYLSEVDNQMGSRESTVKYQYDAYGNISQLNDQGDVLDGSDDRTTYTSYSNNTSAYIVGLATHTYTMDLVGDKLAESWFTYDQGSGCATTPCQGLLTQTEKWLSGGSDPVTVYDYDLYGNLADEFDALREQSKGALGNHTHHNYDPVYEEFQTSMTEGLGSFTLHDSTLYDPMTGQLLSHTDANGMVTQYQYDVFGRLTAVINPADTAALPTMTYQYNINAAPPHSVVSTARVTSGGASTLATYQFYDGLGRARESKAPSSTGKQVVTGICTYDPRGLVSKAYVPFTVTASASYEPEDTTKPFSLTQYDALGRITEVTLPDGTEATRSYSGWDEIDVDANGHEKDYFKNAAGQVVQVTEHNQGQTYNTMYAYDALRRLTQITNSLSKNTVLTYDTLGRKIGMSDPQMGNWTYQYDAVDNLIQQTDAKKQTILLSYDAVHRPLSKKYPDGTSIAYTYDAGSYGINRLSSVTDASGSQSFTYDKLGNLLQKTRSIGGSVYTTKMTYDDLGRETSVTYPNASAVQNIYDGAVLSSVKGASNGITYAALTYDDSAVGKIKGVAYGNGVTSAYTYQPKNFLLSALTSANSSNQTLQHFGYTYDPAGNIKTITDSTNGDNQTFGYDDLDRLTTASGPYGSKTYQYDSFGNMTTAGGVPAVAAADTADALMAVQGTVYATTGRVDKGLYFDGNTTARIGDTAEPSSAISAELWVRPLVTGSTGYVLSKPGVMSVAAPASDGSVMFNVQTSSGLQALSVPNASAYNTWSHWAFTVDNQAIKAYVNGALAAQAPLRAPLIDNTQAVSIGSGFKGVLDGIHLTHEALSAEHALSDYTAAPILPTNQPLAPTNTTGSAVVKADQPAGFRFSAWDLTGAAVKYRVDWGTGTYTVTGLSASGAAVISSHTWATPGVYHVRTQAVKTVNGQEVASAWSPSLSIQVASGSVTTPAVALALPAKGGKEAAPLLAAANATNATNTAPLYDANGNLTSNNGRTITYDYENRPIKIVTADGTITQFVYDYQGDRVKKTITKGSTVQTSIYIGQIYEVNSGVTSQYISAGSLRVAMVSSNGDVLYYLPDHLGSTNVLVDANQSKVRVDIYTPFGTLYQTSGSKDSDYKFTGQRLDDTTGLYYYGARYYDPTLGRFITPDSMVQSFYNPQMLNRYVYCQNNPLVIVDPTGHFSVGDFFKDVGKVESFGLIAAVPQVWNFAEQNKYYIAAGAIAIATYGIGASFAAGSLGASIAQGALAGEVVGGATTAANGGSGQQVLLSTVIQGAEGAATAGVMHGIEQGIPDPIEQIAAKGVVGGSISEALGGSFTKGFAMTSAFASVDSLYGYYVGEEATAASAQENVPGPNGYYLEHPELQGQGVPGMNVNVAGTNTLGGSGFWQQNGGAGKFINSLPDGNAISHIHDEFQISLQHYFGAAVRDHMNIPGMAVATGVSGTALLSSDWGILATKMER